MYRAECRGVANTQVGLGCYCYVTYPLRYKLICASFIIKWCLLDIPGSWLMFFVFNLYFIHFTKILIYNIAFWFNICTSWKDLSQMQAHSFVNDIHEYRKQQIFMVTCPITYLLTQSKVQSPSWAANSFAARQEIPRISPNPKVHYRTHKHPPPVSIQGQPNPVHIPTSHLLEIHPNIIHPSTPA
jgi:hypothetical protein